MVIRLQSVIVGLMSYIPGMNRFLRKKGTGGTDSPRYCYEVWIKHLTMLHENGLESLPDTIAELGPGDSIGIGLAAMLSGANRYYALDIVEYSNIEYNVKIFDELVELFHNRAPRPKTGWPKYDQYLDENLFPSHILTDEQLERSLSEDRIKQIRDVLINPDNANQEIQIKYMVPWADENIIEQDTVDVIFSQSVIEHVMDLNDTYKALYSWLKPGGLMSHQADFSSHGYTNIWNGFRAYPEFVWKITMGRRPYLINRQPYSVHIDLMKKNGFEITCALQNYKTDIGIDRSQLSGKWKDMSDDDLTCSGAFIQARKPNDVML